MTSYLTGVQERLRSAELARVEAQARAEEETKRRALSDELASEAQAASAIERSRRRRTVALAASVLLLSGLAGASWVRIAQDRTARHAVMTQAIADANRLHDLATRNSLVDIARLGEAIASVERAQAVLGPAGDSTERGTIQALLIELEQERQRAERDRDMLARLAEIRQTRGFLDAETSKADAEFAQAFTDYGIPVDVLPAGEAAASMRERPQRIAVELAAALDDWALIRWVSSPPSGGVDTTTQDGPPVRPGSSSRPAASGAGGAG